MGNAVEISQYFVPVIGGRLAANGTFELTNIFGTATPLSPDIYVTAAHVIDAARECGNVCLGRRQTPRYLPIFISEIEFFRSHDIALLKMKSNVATAFLKWSKQPALMLQDVRTCGFPYAIDFQEATVTNRSFKGYVVSNTTYKWQSISTRVYELSFPCPKGLSGAPIVNERSQLIEGIIIGNRITDHEVYSESELLDDGKGVRKYVRTEALHLGIATCSPEILQLRPKFADKSIGELVGILAK